MLDASHKQALDERHARNPERFVRCRPVVAMSPLSVATNPIVQNEDGIVIDERVSFPTLAAAGYAKAC